MNAFSRRAGLDRALYGLAAVLLMAAAACVFLYFKTETRTPAAAPLPAAISPSAGSTAAARTPTSVPVVPVKIQHTGLASTVTVPGEKNIPLVDATVVNNELEPPADVHTVGIWTGGAALDATSGTTLITGHVNYVGQGNGAFYGLSALQKGQTVTTVNAKGQAATWTVTSIEVDVKSAGINPAVFTGRTGPRRLALVTCGGPFNASIASYDDNIVVWATPSAL